MEGRLDRACRYIAATIGVTFVLMFDVSWLWTMHLVRSGSTHPYVAWWAQSGEWLFQLAGCVFLTVLLIWAFLTTRIRGTS